MSYSSRHFSGDFVSVFQYLSKPIISITKTNLSQAVPAAEEDSELSSQELVMRAMNENRHIHKLSIQSGITHFQQTNKLKS